MTNHYCSTGDHIGEGIAMELPDGKIALLVPYNPRELEDRDDHERLLSRLGEIYDEGRISLTIWNDGTTLPTGFNVTQVIVAPADLDALAKALREKPGPAGWGSGKSVIDRHQIAEP